MDYSQNFEQAFKCAYCSLFRTFAIYSLIAHLIAKHRGEFKNGICCIWAECKSRFTSAVSFRRHMKQHIELKKQVHILSFTEVIVVENCCYVERRKLQIKFGR